MRFASLGSGSRGNATLIEANGTCLMVDCGFSVRETERRLRRLDKRPEDIDAIVVTHEHADHIGGVARFAARHDIVVRATAGTLAAIWKRDSIRAEPFSAHEGFVLDGLEVTPIPVPHDAREPAQFKFGDGARRLGLLTDAGHGTPHIHRMLDGCDALILECNHDAAMLAGGPYPASIKRRVGGPLGHLNNDQAGALLAGLDGQRLQHLVAAHLSERNNTAALAREALAGAVGCEIDWVAVADQQAGLDWREIR
jgi:phosphoribosyl 1,2-cyclic phosphodiesterase